LVGEQAASTAGVSPEMVAVSAWIAKSFVMPVVTGMAGGLVVVVVASVVVVVVVSAAAKPAPKTATLPAPKPSATNPTPNFLVKSFIFDSLFYVLLGWVKSVNE
jgi:hypothetical protein